MSTNRGESVLSRWSRRKLEAERPRETAELEPGTPESAPAEDALPANEAEKPPLTDADMPDIETLTEESDFSPFMSPGVSEELRNLALRKLFRAPLFNIRDGLDEYDDDFTQFEKLGDIVTSDMKHRIEMEQQKLRERLAEENREGAGGDPQDDVEAVEAVEEEDFDDEAEVAELDAIDEVKEKPGDE